ncbi:hypothetical protein N7508_004545 [Penicillium antarcticum]|uniref:uncharacterized protein n=1 Tax=Penicillium antarcticum TaxID=416450 RepID=UPI0023877C33|nr:uncharacterized protein N7508_004545 [Penicillium antarcticum]KAJ5309166.1 hypothetical protein N7508_004545 [Penicillium antarcticum]
MHIACGITYTNGAVMRALTQLINLGYGISYSEARELELNIDTKSFEDLRSSREATRFNQQVSELDHPMGMKGGMADDDK